MYLRLLAVLVLFFLAACSSKNVETAEPRRVSQYRAVQPGVSVVDVEVNRPEYLKRLQLGAKLNKARLVEILSRENANIKQYRFLGVREGSVYELLGIKNYDVLIAANDYIIPDPETFWRYISLLSREQAAQIEVRRGEIPTLLNIKFVEK